MPQVFALSYEDHVEKRSSRDTPQNVDVISNERVDPVDSAVIVCEGEVHSINQNSVRYNQRTGIDLRVALHDVVVEIDPQVFEVANLEA